MSDPLTLQQLEALRPGSRRGLTGLMVGVLGLGLNLPGRRVRFEVQGWGEVPTEPCVIVANHTHFMDWVALRWVAWRRGVRLCNWVKPRTYEEGWGRFLDQTGNIPLASRGYLLAADVRAVHGRVPTEAEYRALRDHLDSGQPLPGDAFTAALTDTARDVLGVPFDPADESYRSFMEGLFHRMMQATLHHTRGLCDQGIHLQIMPEGVTSVRLTRGHPGALQAALALGLPLLPVGINGFPQAWGGKQLVPGRGGTVTVRVGPPFHPDPIDGHTPFLPASERANAEALATGTEAVMARIAALLDPVHGPGSEDDLDVQGVARFV